MRNDPKMKMEMKQSINLVMILVYLCSTVQAGDGKFHIEWGDIFPMCAAGEEDYNSVRCGCEFLVPNFHIGLIGDMFKSSLSSFLLLDAITSFIVDMVERPLETVSGFVGGIITSIQETLFPSSFDQGITGAGNNIIHSLSSWFFGVTTPLLVIFLILSIEFVKTYLCITIPFMLWVTVLKELNLMKKPSSMWGVRLAGITVILMFIGSIWLLGSDFGLYSPLVVW